MIQKSQNVHIYTPSHTPSTHFAVIFLLSLMAMCSCTQSHTLSVTSENDYNVAPPQYNHAYPTLRASGIAPINEQATPVARFSLGRSSNSFHRASCTSTTTHLSSIENTHRRNSRPTLAQAQRGYANKRLRSSLDATQEAKKAGNYYVTRSLFAAIDHRNIGAVQHILTQGANLEDKHTHGETPLLMVTRKEDIELVKLLISRGANLEAKDAHGDTPLLVAIRKGHINLVKLLISRGANLEAKDAHGDTPLLIATRREHIALVELLTSQGANLETKDASDETPLLMAIRKEHLELVQLLIKQGGSLEALSINGDTPLLMATRKEHTQLVKLLMLQGSNLEAKDIDGETPLIVAIQQEHKELVKLFLAHGANLEARDRYGETPLFAVISMGNKKLFKLLLLKKANLEMKNNDGETPLLLATWLERSKFVKTLLNQGANPEAKDFNGETSLFFAIKKENFHLTKMLVDSNVDLTRKNKEGVAPLFLAMRQGSVPIVKLLLQTPRIPINEVNYAFYLIEARQWELVHLLLAREDLNVSLNQGGNGPTILRAILATDFLDILAKILQHPTFNAAGFDAEADKLFDEATVRALSTLIWDFPEQFKKIKHSKRYLLKGLHEGALSFNGARIVLLHSPLCKGNFECPICFENFQRTNFAFCSNPTCGGKCCLSCMQNILNANLSQCYWCRDELPKEAITAYINHLNLS